MGYSSNKTYAGFDPDALDYIQRWEANTSSVMPDILKQAWYTFFSTARSEGWLANVLELFPFMGTSVNGMIEKPIYAKKFGGNRRITNAGFVDADIDPTYKCLKQTGTKHILSNITPLQLGTSHGIFVYSAQDITIASISNIGFFGGTTINTASSNQLYWQNGGGGSWNINGMTGGAFLGATGANNLGANKGLYHFQVNPSYGGIMYVNGMPGFTSATIPITANLSPDNTYFFRSGGIYLGGYTLALGGFTDGNMSATNNQKFSTAISKLLLAYGLESASECVDLIISTGQSNAVGAGSTSIINTTIGGGYTFAGGLCRGIGQIDEVNSQKFNGIHGTRNIKPIAEEGGIETGWCALIQNLNSRKPNTYLWMSVAAGSTGYSGLKKGQTGYDNSISFITRFKSFAQGRNMRVPFIPIVHGESDGGSTTYQTDIRQWQVDYQNDINATLGRSDIIPMFHSQYSGWNSTGNLSLTTAKSPFAMYDEAKLNPTLTKLVCAKYFLIHNETDGIHILASEHIKLSELYQYAIWQDVYTGIPFKPLWPELVTRVNNVIEITFHLPSGVLALDNTFINDPGNYGFEFYAGTGGNTPTITGVAITDWNKVQITLSAIPTGTGRQIRYAYTAQNTGSKGGGLTWGGGPNNGGPRGCLRNTVPIPSSFGYTTYHWCVHFAENVS